MTAKQQIATGLLAVIIVCSVAFMPANADSSAPKPGSRQHTAVVATKANGPNAPRNATHDLTYN